MKTVLLITPGFLARLILPVVAAVFISIGVIWFALEYLQ